MNEKHLAKFVSKVASFDLTGDDLRAYDAHERFNRELDEMDSAYGKNAKVYYAKEFIIINILKQIVALKKRDEQ